MVCKKESKINEVDEYIHEENDVNELANMINRIDLHTDHIDNGNSTKKKNWIVPSLGSEVNIGLTSKI